MNFEIIETGDNPNFGRLCLAYNTKEVKKFLIKNNLNFYASVFYIEIKDVPGFDNVPERGKRRTYNSYLGKPTYPYVFFSLPAKEILRGLINET